MTDGNGVDPEAGGELSKEALFPNGMPGTREWNTYAKSQRRAATEAATNAALEAGVSDEIVEQRKRALEEHDEFFDGKSPDEAEEPEDGVLADEQTGDAEEGESAEPDAVAETIRAYDFAKQAGWKLDEFYSGVTVPVDGQEVPLGKAVNEWKALKDANDALIKERSELQEKVKQGAVSVPQQQYSPEAQALLQQAQMYQQALDTQDWSQVENSANVRLEYMAARDKLVQQAQAKQGEWQQELTKKYQTALEEAERQTRASIPEWNDTKVREIEQRGIGDMLSAYGIKQQEIDTVIDPRWRRFFRDAFKARTQTERIAQGVKKIRKVGKSLPPGSRAGLPKTPTLAGARAALKKAREAGANKVDIDTARLQVQLPDIKPGKRK